MSEDIFLLDEIDGKIVCTAFEWKEGYLFDIFRRIFVAFKGNLLFGN